MELTVYIEHFIGETRVVLMKGNKPIEIHLFRDHQPSLLGTKLEARIRGFSPDGNAAFLDLNGFGEAYLPIGRTLQKGKHLKDGYHEGQKIWVEITREKDPLDNKSAIVREIKKPEKTRIQSPNSITAAQSWLASQKGVASIKVNDPEIIRSFTLADQPCILCEEDFFEEQGLNDLLDSIADNRMDIPGGGQILLEGGRAVTIMDVNQGNSKETETLNERALKHTFYAMRLMNMGGLIVLDLLNARNQERPLLEKRAQTLAEKDTLKTRISNISDFWLLEIERQKKGPDLRALLNAFGQGPNTETRALEGLRRIQQSARKNPDFRHTLTLDEEAARWLNRQPELLRRYQQKYAVTLDVVSGPDKGETP